MMLGAIALAETASNTCAPLLFNSACAWPCTCLRIESVAVGWFSQPARCRLRLTGAHLALESLLPSPLANRSDANCRWRAVVYDGSIAFFPGLMFFVQAIAPLCGIVGTCLLPKWGEELAPGG